MSLEELRAEVEGGRDAYETLADRLRELEAADAQLRRNAREWMHMYDRQMDPTKLYAELREAAANVVASQRGDLSRKPHMGRLRDALAKLPK